MKNVYALLFVVQGLVWGDIVEVSNFEEIKVYVQQAKSTNGILVFDIDNTLLEAGQHLGSVAWGDYMVNEMKKKGISHQEAEEIASIFWKTVQPHIKVKTVDPDTKEIIEAIQEKKIPVICLTSRNSAEIENTHGQLASLGIYPTHLINECQIFHLNRNALYEKGILFATLFNKKSNVLIEFLERNQFNPEWVIFVDDKLSHVHDVDSMLQEKGISCKALRFSGADKQYETFDPEVAEVQWKAIPHFLSNEEALEILMN